MRGYVRIFLLCLLLLGALPAPLSAAVTRDPSFDGDGRLQVSPSGLAGYEIFSRDTVSDIAVDQKGRVVVVGSTDGIAGVDHSEAVVARFAPNGSLDGSFSGDGVLHFGWEPEHSNASAAAIDHQGRIVVGGGTANYPDLARSAVARFLPNGDPDPTFSGDGLALAKVGDGAAGIAVDARDRILMTSRTYLDGERFGTTRFTQSGAIDESFGGDGLVLTDFPGADSASSTAIAVDPSGRAIVVGRVEFTKGSSLAIARYTESGGLDPSFDGDGRALLDFGTLPREYARDVVLDQDGRVAVVGEALLGGFGETRADYLTLVGRLLPDGTPDPSFSGDGRTITPGSGWVEPEGAVIDSAGRIVVAGSIGSDQTPSGSIWSYAVQEAFLMRYGTDGTLEEGIAPEGVVRESFLAPLVANASVAVDQQGRYLLAGSLSAETLGGPLGFVGVARFLVDYPPVTDPRPQPPPSAPRCLGQEASIVGTEARDVLRGTKGRDVIVGLGGDDLLRGLAGKDRICAGPGADTLKAGAGDDVVRGEAGRDHLFGEGGEDRLTGGAGVDQSICGPGRDVSVADPRDRIEGCERLVRSKPHH
jgi:uncharacterized delta-60 repeat protein